MKTLRSARSLLLGTLACCALAAPRFALAQPEAPVAATDAPKAQKGKKAGKNKPGKNQRGKKLMPRVVTATETALGQALTPNQKTQITAAMRDRDAAVKAANDAYYAAFAQATGLTAEQAKEIDKPGRNGGKGADGAKAPMEPKVEGKTNMDALTDTDEVAAPVTPK